MQMTGCLQYENHSEIEDKQGNISFISPGSPWLYSKGKHLLIK